MRRTMLAVLTAVALVLLTAIPSLAASPHFKRGGEPTCTISGSGTSRTVVCRGSITGLGNGDLTIESTVSGFALYQCQNPGGNLSPGQNRVLEGPQTVPTVIPSGEIKNGNVSFTTNPNTLTADPTVSGAAAGCPNGNWTGVNPTLSITSLVLDISQSSLIFHCTASNPAGLSGTVALSC